MCVDMKMKVSLRDQLKQHTLQSHQQLEQSLDILGQGWTSERYVQLLQKFAVFHVEFEQQLREFPTVWPFYQSRLKTPLLREDLPSMPEEGSTEVRQFLATQLQEEADAWGLLYVIEGSTHGGQVLTRHFEKLVGERSRYFASYGADVVSQWQRFVATLDARPFSEREVARAVRSAERLFQFFLGYLPVTT